MTRRLRRLEGTREQPTFRTRDSMMVEMGAYPAMYSRVFSNDIRDRGVVDDFMSLTEDGSVLDPTTLSKITSRILRPQSLPQSEIIIENGFGERRIVFMFGVETRSRLSPYPKISVISGYTDRIDISLSGLVDPEMRMYINSYSQINQAGIPRPVDVSQIISANAYEAFNVHDYKDNPYGKNSLKLMRPMDVIRSMSFEHSDPMSNNIDSSNTVSSARNLSSRRSNGMPSRYVSNILGSVINSEDDDIYSPTTRNYRYHNARGAVTESNLMNDPFIRELRQNHTFMKEGFVTYDDLCYILPDFDSNTLLATMRNQPDLVTRESRALNSQDWAAPTDETIAATIISQSMGAILTSCLLTYLECEFSNESLSGDPFIRIINMAAFSTIVDPKSQKGRLEFLILKELMPILTFDNEFSINVKMKYDLTLDMQLSISWDNGPWEDFVCPSFCDSLLSPVITGNDDTITNITQNLGSFVDAILETTPSRSTGYDY